MNRSTDASSNERLVSVIVPAFNYGRFVGETLESLRAQTHDTWECIVVDDGSTDDTAGVVKAWSERDPRIRYLRQPNRGQPSARNLGLRSAGGGYVQLLDADDLIEPDKLALQVEFLEHHPEADLVYGDVQFFPTDHPEQRRASLDETGRDWMPRLSGTGADIIRVAIEQNIMVINSPLVRRRVFDEVGLFDESLPRADDWDMWLRCALAGKHFAYHDPPDSAALVRVHPGSLTQRDRRLLAASVMIHRKAAPLIGDRQLLGRNDAIVTWLERVLRFTTEINRVIPRECAFILVDDDRIRPEMPGYRAIPFTERDGVYNGPPANGADAVTEVHRLRNDRAAGFIVFSWLSTWYLDHYPPLREHLHSQYSLILDSDEAVIYDLRRS